MSRKYYDADADLEFLSGRTVAVLGYGNQGRSQALNLRDSGVVVIVGSGRADASEANARADGFDVCAFPECVERADVLLLLLPDEVFPQIYDQQLLPRLRGGQVLCFASGYNVYYKLVRFPMSVDVVLLAPRMIGEAVRDLFVEGSGAPSLIAVDQDASGHAREIVLALAKGIGATRTMALDSSFEEETITDLMGEQGVGGSMLYFCRMLCEVLIEAGVSPEAALLEVYASGENIAVAKAVNRLGLWPQLKLHSHTSQYGHQTRGRRLVTEETRKVLRAMVEDIRSGAFQKEWTGDQAGGRKEFDRIWRENLEHPIMRAEDALYRELGRR
jgi:ketol-acid reductoisomerase